MAEHNGWIEEDYVDGFPHAECTCGWTGPTRETNGEAKGDLAQHYEEVSGG